jgi:hypothetical protein
LDDFGDRSLLEHGGWMPPIPAANTAGAQSIPVPDGSSIEPLASAADSRSRIARGLECRNGLARRSIPGRAMKKADALLPEGEGLRRAVAWLAEQPARDLATIEEASRRFNLSPLDEDFLLQHFRGPGRGKVCD